MLVHQQHAVTRSLAYLGWTLGITAALAAGLALDAAHDVTGAGAAFAAAGALALLLAICMGRDTFRITTLRVLLTAFAACEGVLFARVVELVDLPVLAAGLGAGAAVFLTMAVWGLVTHRDLTSLSALLFWSLIALLGCLLVAVLYGAGPFALLLVGASVVLFSLYTAHDVQWIIREASTAVDAEAAERVAIDGAIALYLDLANLLLDMVRAFDWLSS